MACESLSLLFIVDALSRMPGLALGGMVIGTGLKKRTVYFWSVNVFSMEVLINYLGHYF